MFPITRVALAVALVVLAALAVAVALDVVDVRLQCEASGYVSAAPGLDAAAWCK